MAQPRDAVAVVAVYKVTKALLQLAIAAVLAVLVLRGDTDRIVHHLASLSHSAIAAWSTHVAAMLTPRRIEVTSAALAFDGAFTGLEGWALTRRYAWAPWLVVVSTSLLVPLEIVALLRHFSGVRVAALGLNLGVVFVLVRHIGHHVQTRRTMGARPLP